MTDSPHLSLDALLDALGGASPAGDLPGRADLPLLVVDLDAGRRPAPSDALHPGFARVVLGRTSAERPEEHPAAAVCDIVLHADDGTALAAVEATAAEHPTAATALAVLLRGAGTRSVDDGLQLESAVYSALLAGPDFAAWRAARPRRDRADEREPVSLHRDGERLDVTLARPHVRNALDAAMRDQLVDAFRLVAADPSIAEVHLRGAGPSFCAGGDLDEFGTAPDVGSAHLLRLQQSAGRAIHAVADRVTAHLHGACVGSGIELPAFAGRVLAHPGTRIALPELGLGLIPGAGGTVSLPRRIGRHRTARLALTGETIDADTALRWGLVDAVEDTARGATGSSGQGTRT